MIIIRTQKTSRRLTGTGVLYTDGYAYTDIVLFGELEGPRVGNLALHRARNSAGDERTGYAN